MASITSVDTILGALSGGGARSNRFRVTVQFPSFAGGASQVRKSSFLCRAASIPFPPLGVLEVPWMGRTAKLAGDRGEFEDWSATFYNDNDYDLYKTFAAWSNGINNISSNQGTRTPSEYMSDVIVEQLDVNGNTIYTQTLKLAWPRIVGEIELNMEDNNQIEQFRVTFAYSDLSGDAIN